MIYILFSIINILRFKRNGAISTILFCMMLATSLCAYLVGRQQFLDDGMAYLTSFYTALLLSILFLSFKGYAHPLKVELFDVNMQKLASVERILGYMALLAFLIDAFILSRIFPLLVAGAINVDEFKNDGGAMDIIDTLVPHIFVSFSNLFSAVGYFFLSLHFYYLVKGIRKKAIYTLILSSVIVLSRLIALSRSTTVEFLSIYILMLTYVFPLLANNTKKWLFICMLGSAFLMFASMNIISTSRFESYYPKYSKNEALLDEQEDPVIFSTIDYYAQWIESNDYALKRYSPENLMYGEHSFSSITTWFQKKIQGADVVLRRREILSKKALGDVSTGFPGLIARLVVDFGLLGTFIFVLLFSKIIKRCRPTYGVVNLKTLLILPIALNVISLFWAGNFFSSMALNIAIFFNILIYRKVSN